MENAHIKTSPKDVFLHLFNIVTFYLSVVGFIILWVQYINSFFPDALNYYFTAISETVRVAESILFVAVPAYLLSSWLLAKDLRVIPEKRELKLRKWLVYFTLFISALTIIVDLMIFVYNFLNGELNIQFFLKVLAVLLVACAVFGYYMWDLRRKDLKSKMPMILGILMGVIAGGSIIVGFFVVGTPAEQRNRRFDEQRVFDLQSLQYQVVDYWAKKDVLPASLSNLEDSISGFMAPVDPASKESYEYRVSGPLSFELCAVFARDNTSDKTATNQQLYPGAYGSINNSWNHEAGRICFARTIDPELYKINKAETAPLAAPVR